MSTDIARRAEKVAKVYSGTYQKLKYPEKLIPLIESAIQEVTQELQRTGCDGTEYTHIRNVHARSDDTKRRLEACSKYLESTARSMRIMGDNSFAQVNDTKRLEFWIQLTRYHRSMHVYEAETPKGERYWCAVLTSPYERFTGKTPSEAIDAAMKREGK